MSKKYTYRRNDTAGRKVGRFLMATLEVMGEVAEEAAKQQQTIADQKHWLQVLELELASLTDWHNSSNCVRVVMDGSEFWFSTLGNNIYVQQTPPNGTARWMGQREYQRNAEVVMNRLHIPGIGLGGRVQRIEVRRSSRVLRTHS